MQKRSLRTDKRGSLLGSVDVAKCMRCGTQINSFSPMRKWCFDCRKKVTVEQARARKGRR